MPRPFRLDVRTKQLIDFRLVAKQVHLLVVGALAHYLNVPRNWVALEFELALLEEVRDLESQEI